MRLNGSGVLTLEDARTWLEETGLCLFSPRRQYSSSLAPSFAEAVAGQSTSTPNEKQLALAEDLLVRLEKNDVAVRLNLLGQPGEQTDFVVAAWVLPYVYALRGDRDWRRTPQLTGSRQVSPLAIQAYKLLEAGEQTVPQLVRALGREVTETAVVRAITELWQQLRIIPVVDAPGQTPRWQLLRQRFQKAIAEGASTSQVTAISVLASIYLQAVIAASMEEVELFLAPLTARSKVREVLRGLVATRQVHTMSVGHAPHYYVAGTLPEFTPPPTLYASAAMQASSYFLHSYEREEEARPVVRVPEPKPETPVAQAAEAHLRRPAARKPSAPAPKPAAARPHFSRPAVHSRDRKPAQSSPSGRVARHAKSSHPNHSSASRSSRPAAASASRGLKSASAGTRTKHAVAKTASKPAHSSRTRPVAAGAKAGSGKGYGFSSSSRQGSKKRG
jgi:23S rRNA pseudouridine2605 synthase